MSLREKILNSNSCNIFSRISNAELDELKSITSFLHIDSSVNKRYFYVKNNLSEVVKCKVCSNEPNFFGVTKGYSKYCSKECQKLDTKNKLNESNKQTVELSKKLLIEHPNDYVKCEICGFAAKSISSHLKKHKDWTIDKYKLKFPNSLIVSKSESQRMSDNWKGEKNCNHKSKTTEEQRKSTSPFSKDFKKYKSEEDRTEFIKKIDYESRLLPSNIQYWINKGFSEQYAKEKVSNNQRTFTLEKCITKYGQEEGTKRWKKFQIIKELLL